MGDRLGRHQCEQVGGHGWWVGEDVCRGENRMEDIGGRIMEGVGCRLRG